MTKKNNPKFITIRASEGCFLYDSTSATKEFFEEVTCSLKADVSIYKECTAEEKEQWEKEQQIEIEEEEQVS